MKTDLKNALWGDLKTDEERADWLRLGRGYETGVIAKSLQHEVAMAFHFRAGIMKERREQKPA
jgi:hypothetical protein